MVDGLAQGLATGGKGRFATTLPSRTARRNARRTPRAHARGCMTGWEDEPHPAIASRCHNVRARGCPNLPKDGIVPLDGIKETDGARRRMDNRKFPVYSGLRKKRTG